MPRPNGYQSLHTSVISEHGMPFEVQIRTIEMHRMAEEGIAAHWKYKEGRVGDQRDERYFQLDAAAARVPAGGPRSAGVHPEPQGRALSGGGLHLHAEGAGQGAPARRDADRLRLRDSHRRRPPVRRRARQRQDGAAPHAPQERRHRRDHHADRAQAEPRLAELRRHVARAQQDQAPDSRRGEDARRRARAQAVREGSAPLRPERQDASLDGEAFAKALVRLRRSARPTISSRRSATARFSRSRCFVKLVPGRLAAREAAGRARWRRSSGACSAPARRRSRSAASTTCMVFRARCCNPIRGEKIVGYITRGKGVSVHSATCPNVVNLLYDPERRIDVEWDKGDRESRATP